MKKVVQIKYFQILLFSSHIDHTLILIKYLNDMYKNVELVRAGLDIQLNLYELILLVCTDSKA